MDTHYGPPVWTPIMDPHYGPPFWTPILDPHNGPPLWIPCKYLMDTLQYIIAKL
jgi:hypothetical protein